MSDNVTLHPEKGVNPRIGYCVRCGTDHSVILLGMWNRAFHCSECDTVTFGAKYHRCEKCKGKRGEMKPIGEGERLPAGLCRVCKEEIKDYAAIVAEGGVYWNCEDCKASGVILPNALTRDVRSTHGLVNGEPCGVTFNKETCPACSSPDDVEQL